MKQGEPGMQDIGEVADWGLAALAQAFSCPDDLVPADIFAPDLIVLSRGRAFSFGGPQVQRAMCNAIRETARALGIDRIDRQLGGVLADDDAHLRVLHTSRWFSGKRLVVGPFSSLVSYGRGAPGWRIERIQVSAEAPCHLAEHFGDRMAQTPALRTLQQAQSVIDSISRAIVDNDLPRFRTHLRLPFVLQWGRGLDVLRTPEDVARHFKAVWHDLQHRGVTEIIRSPKRISLVTANQITASYVTYLLAGGLLAAPSYENGLTLEKSESGAWVVTSLLNPRLEQRSWELTTA